MFVSKAFLKNEADKCLEDNDFPLSCRPFLLGADCECDLPKEQHGSHPSPEEWRRQWDALKIVDGQKELCPDCGFSDPFREHTPDRM